MQLLRTKRFILFACFISFVLFMRFSGYGAIITLEGIKEQSDLLQHYVANQYIFSVLVYCLVYAVGVALSFPIAALMSMLGGFLFGTLAASVYANIAATIGATCSFLLVRYLIGGMIQQNYASSLQRFNSAMHQYGTVYLFMVHMIAVIPFFLVNILAGLTQVPVWTFIWTTSLGVYPGGLVFALAGQQLGTIDSMSDVFSWNIALAFAALALLAVIPVIISHTLGRFGKRRRGSMYE